ncbi:MAG: helix-turn-helix domain-containing protein [Actinomycetota bacterium]|nr:helix-turn-helix domain-containing protein [Actinomycetota bacterium]
MRDNLLDTAAADSLTTRDLCQILQVSRPVVQQLIRSGDLPATKLTRHHGWKVARPAFEAWVQAQYADTRAWFQANGPTAAGTWDRHTGGPTR